MKTLHFLLWLVLATAALLAAACFSFKAALAPLPGEWSTRLRLGPLQLEAGIPSLIRLATAPWVGPLMHGRSLTTAAGPVRTAWLPQSRTLVLRCTPCRIHAAGLGEEAVHLQELQATVRRNGEQLSGELQSGQLRASWRGELARDRLRLRLHLPMSPIAHGYALFAPAIPELAYAQIDGRFALDAQLTLPGGTLSLRPQVEGFQVGGLGTGALAGARSACGAHNSRLTADSWLARAVVAAEDQRFHEHGGYDLAELAVAFRQNQREGRVERGASTLNQQLAKLLVTGGERSPVRKLRELLYAVEMEQTLGKPRILGLYLAHAPWGDGLCGAQAAARHYFGRRAHELGPTQAAWLAAMLHNPQLEGQRWRDTGQINVARTQAIIMSLRPLPRQRRIDLAAEAAQLQWQPPRQPDPRP